MDEGQTATLEQAAMNNAGFLEHLGRSMGRRWVRWDDLWAVDAGSPIPNTNSATLLSEPRSWPDVLDRLDTFFGEGPPNGYYLWSAWDTPDLEPFGFTRPSRLPCMIRPPNAAGSSEPAPVGLVVQEVRDADGLVAFEEALIEGFELWQTAPVIAGDLWDERILGAGVRLWVGSAEGRPVSCAVAHESAGCVGVYCVATVPEVRRRGFGEALTWRAVESGAALPAVLTATPLGYPVYLRMGFREVAEFSVWFKSGPNDPGPNPQ